MEFTMWLDRREGRVGLLSGTTAGARMVYLDFAIRLCVGLVRADAVLVHSGIPVGTTIEVDYG